ncbi:MAG: hypothetical protein WCB14_03375 [Candidatus Acidiferrales bacterium]
MNASLTPAAAGTTPAAVPGYRLFDATSVFIASLLGSPVAGVSLMAINYRRMGKGQTAILTLLIGIVATVLASVLGYFVPSSGSIAIGIGIALGTRSAAQYLQGAEVNQHEVRGGQLGSKWAAVGVGLAFLAVLCGVIVAAALGPWADHKLIVGSKDEVYYSGSATKQDAQALGEALKTVGYFQDKGFSVVLSKDKDGTAISFVVKEGVWDDAAMQAGFEQIGRQLAPSVGGLPIKVRLMDSSRATKKEIAVER